MKKVFVTGGTGFLGSYILQALINQHTYHIKALKRVTSKMDLVSGIMDEIEWVEGDILDITSLDQHVDGCDIIIHAAADVVYHKRAHRLMLQNNIEGTQNVVNIALKHAISKFIHISSIAALGKAGNNPVDETAVWNDDGFYTQYSYSKYLAELEVWRGFAEGLDGIILNPSIIIGSTNWHKGTGLIFQKVDQGIKFYPVGKSGFVDVRDVIQAVLSSLQTGLNHQRFVINGDNLGYYQLLSEIALHLRKEKPAIPLSKWWRKLATPLSWLAQHIPFVDATISPEIIRNTAREVMYSAVKSQQMLNIQYRPWKETIKDTAEFYLTWKIQNPQSYRLFPF